MRELFLHKDGKEVVNKKQLKAFIEELPTGKWLLKAESRNKRTIPQNRYLHLMFSMIQKGLYELGYREIKDVEDVKYVCKDLFLSYTTENGVGGKIRMHRRTRDLTKEEMSIFIEECIQWAAQYLSIVIPHPSEQTAINY